MLKRAISWRGWKGQFKVRGSATVSKEKKASKSVQIDLQTNQRGPARGCGCAEPSGLARARPLAYGP
eukprot:scaffold120717_cov63-Phaeocystis_antarctica.AAC.1